MDYSAERITVVKWNGTMHEHPHVDHEEWKFLFSEKSEFVRGSMSSDEIIAGYKVDLHFIRYSNFYMSILIVPVAVISMVLFPLDYTQGVRHGFKMGGGAKRQNY